MAKKKHTNFKSSSNVLLPRSEASNFIAHLTTLWKTNWRWEWLGCWERKLILLKELPKSYLMGNSSWIFKSQCSSIVLQEWHIIRTHSKWTYYHRQKAINNSPLRISSKSTTTATRRSTMITATLSSHLEAHIQQLSTFLSIYQSLKKSDIDQVSWRLLSSLGSNTYWYSYLSFGLLEN